MYKNLVIAYDGSEGAKAARAAGHPMQIFMTDEGIRFTTEPKFKELKASLPKHKSKYAAGRKIVAQFDNKDDLTVTEFHTLPR